MRFPYFSLFLGGFAIASAAGCSSEQPVDGVPDASATDAASADARASDAAQPDAAIPLALYPCPEVDSLPGALVGCVANPEGYGLPEARVTRLDVEEVTDERGVFVFADDIDMGNALITVQAIGYKSEFVVHLAPEQRMLPRVVLTPKRTGRTRFIFGGDTAFARRFLDVDASTPRGFMPPDDPNALILVSDPVPGSLASVSYVRSQFREADIAVLNFETPVTDEPMTPHPTKPFAYFTLPASLQALVDLGVDYVSLGNNHVYDYLARGLDDTLEELGDIGIPYSGAGISVMDAFRPTVIDAEPAPYSMLSMTSISGEVHDIHYVAGPKQGGAANLNDDDLVNDLIADEAAAGRIPIVQFHQGFEYTYEPADSNVDRMEEAVDAGAAMVLAHHPHVAQGFGFYRETFLAHSLGNFIFDQDRLETMLGVVVRLDMDGDDLFSARAIPVYLEDYRPRPIGGEWATRFLRRLAEFSHGHGATVIPYHGQGIVIPDSESVVVVRRELQVPVDIPERGWTVLDLRQIADAHESLEHVQANGPGVTLRAGRGLMGYGGFEDWDVDEQTGETGRWDYGTSVTPCQPAMRGRVALCSQRTSTNTVPSRVTFRNRVRVIGEARGTPNKDVSLLVYGRGDNAGETEFVLRYAASVGDLEFGQESQRLFNVGTFDWTAASVDVTMPPDDPDEDANNPEVHARALRMLVNHSQPMIGTAIFAMDDVALINWEEDITNQILEVPHARDYIRVQGPEGTTILTLTLLQLRPRLAEPEIPNP